MLLVLWELARSVSLRELWSYPSCTWLVMVFELGIELKPNVCWQLGSSWPYATLFYPSVLSAPPSTIRCRLPLHPSSSSAGKESEKLTYLGAIQEQDSPEFSAS